MSTTSMSTAAAPGAVTPAHLPRNPPRASLAALALLNLRGGLSCLFIVLLALACVAAPWIAPYSPTKMDLQVPLSGPTLTHWLGTDQLGRDVLSRMLHGGRSTFLAMLEVTVTALLVGVSGGLVAGYAGGRLDAAIARTGDLVIALPGFVLLLVVYTIFPRSNDLVMVVTGLICAPSVMRVTRSVVLRVRSELYVDAAIVAGLTRRRILASEVLPRVVGTVLVQATLLSGQAIVISTGLAFLGFGVQPPNPSWGSLVADGATAMQEQPWLIIPTGGVIALTVLALGLMGDAVREAVASRWTGTAAGTTPPRLASANAALPDEPSASGADTGDLLVVHNMSVVFGGASQPLPVTRGVSFSLKAGETLGIVGESGCGKSVTVRAIPGLLRSAGRIGSGEVLFGGQDLARMPEKQLARLRGARISLIAQEPMAAFDPTCSIARLLGAIIRRHHSAMQRREVDARVLELLSLVQITSPATVADSYPHELSGGMAQRVAIAAALAGNPQVLIADEPTTALDVTVQAEILDLLRGIQARTGMAILLVTHDWGVVADICDRVVVMYAGQVVEEGGVEEVFAAPKHPYTSALMASNPERGHKGSRLPTIPGTVPEPSAWPVGCHFADRCGHVMPACRQKPIALRRTPDGRLSRCIVNPFDQTSPPAAGTHE